MSEKRNYKRIICLILVFITLLVLSAVSYGNVSEDIADYRQELSDIQAKRDELAELKSLTEEESAAIVQQINAHYIAIAQYESDIKDLNIQINNLQDSIKEKMAQIEEIKASLSQENNELNQRLVVAYKTRNTNTLTVLLNSGSFTELISNISKTRMIIRANEELIDEIKKENEALEQARKELLEEYDALKSAQEKIEKEVAEYRTKTAELEAYEQELQSKLKELDLQDKLYEKDAAEITAAIKELSSKGEYAGGEICYPCASPLKYTSYFNTDKTRGRMHYGIDIAAYEGIPILAANSGKVIKAEFYGGYGNCVIIDHGGDISTLYGHASKLLVSEGDIVTRGQTIALVGTTGNSTGNHLHFEIRYKGVPYDPLDQSKSIHLPKNIKDAKFYID